MPSSLHRGWRGIVRRPLSHGCVCLWGPVAVCVLSAPAVPAFSRDWGWPGEHSTGTFQSCLHREGKQITPRGMERRHVEKRIRP